MSATTEPTAVETAASEVSATKASTSSEVSTTKPTTPAAASHCLTHRGKQNYTN
jgi:hypothetical protein